MQYTFAKIIFFKPIYVALFIFSWNYHCFALELVIRPTFSIWDVELGRNVSELNDAIVGEIGCGTGGGPIGKPLISFKNFKDCDLSISNLYELAFTYDDEKQYIAKALNIQHRAMTAITTVYSHQVIISILVQPNGEIVGFRIISDPRAQVEQRSRIVALGKVLLNRFSKWDIKCVDKFPEPGEMPVGNLFIKSTCTGLSPDLSVSLRLDMSYFRKDGQNAVNPETQNINTGYFEGKTHLTILRSSFPNKSTLSKNYINR